MSAARYPAIDIRPIDIGTELTFTHALLKTENSRNSHERGWRGALDKLDHYVSAETCDVTEEQAS